MLSTFGTAITILIMDISRVLFKEIKALNGKLQLIFKL